ncbi:MAG: putative Tau-tubulin kinase [Streblomastix strix]|uniref:Putative Tau-tubulin kinase n=1 Tax=Streblomastix strix TaxID=222440 RepID=A0A5J4WWG0_9EUKA|nr:MAG: putative Tau-tubulin kinase [Streblomastix strix]
MDKESPFSVGDVIKNRYELVKRISQGKFKETFYAVDPQIRQIALKIEKQYEEEQTGVCIEAAILKILAGSKHFPKFYEYGSHKNYKFLALELLGPNLIELVNYKKPYRFSLHSVLKFGIQAIEILHRLHSKGIVHRDVNSENFAVGNEPNTSGTFYLTDFSMCKKLNEVGGKITKPTTRGKFRGSLMYASLNSHKFIELGRHDDLISLFYILVEFFNGTLPWSGVTDVEEIKSVKEYYQGIKLLKSLPKQFLEIEQYISTLDYQTDPNYQFITSLLNQAAQENNINLNQPFEFEEEINEERKKIMVRHAKYNNKVKKIISDIDQEINKIRIQKNKDLNDRIEELEQEKQDQIDQLRDPQQLKVQVNVINILHKLKKKYQQQYIEEVEQGQNENQFQMMKIGSSKRFLKPNSRSLLFSPTSQSSGSIKQMNRFGSLSPTSFNQANSSGSFEIRQQSQSNGLQIARARSQSYKGSERAMSPINKQEKVYSPLSQTNDITQFPSNLGMDRQFSPIQIDESPDSQIPRVNTVQQFRNILGSLVDSQQDEDSTIKITHYTSISISFFCTFSYNINF